MRVTIQQIAQSQNLSTATVSRVLSGRDDAFISEATRRRVLKASREMGYQTNRAARALVTGRTHLVAYWMPHLHEPFYAGTIHHVQQQIKTSGFEMIVGQAGGALNRPTQWPVDGILAMDFLGTEQAFRDAVGRTPCVGLGNYYVRSAPFVGIDLYAGATEAVRHLLSPGARRVAYLVPEYGCAPGDGRFDAYTHAVTAAGRAPEYVRVPDHKRATARQGLRAYIAAHGCPDALFCRNDDLAIGAYRALRDEGRLVPDDVALVGCDGIEDTEYLDTPLSTLVQPIPEACAMAWEFLRRCMDDPKAELQQALLRPRLVVRASSTRA